MAAANTKCRGVALATLGKRFLIATTHFPRSTPSFRKCLHTSVYDKNVEEHVRPAVVPDEVVMEGGQPDKYWAPNPQTGVFGPDSEPNMGANADPAFHTSPATTAGGATHSVLEHKAFFRPLEDLDKPQHP